MGEHICTQVSHPAGVNVTIGAGGSVHTPLGIGIGIDGGVVLDTNKNACFYSNVCYTVGPGISGSLGVVGSIGSGQASTGTTEYNGASGLRQFRVDSAPF